MTTTNTDDVIKQEAETTTPAPTTPTTNLANDIKALRHETRKLAESLRLRQNRLLRQYQRQSQYQQQQQQQQQTGTTSSSSTAPPSSTIGRFQIRGGGKILGRIRRRSLFGR